jgi:hypothetical protein
MEFQYRQSRKTIIEVGDRVEYRHPIVDIDGAFASIPAKIVGIDRDKYSISISCGTQGNPTQTEVETTIDRLTQLMEVDNPLWLAYQLEKSEKISYADWVGKYLYDESSEQFFESQEEFYEWHEENQTEKDNIPDYCFATRCKTFKVESAEDLVEYWIEDDEDLDYSDFEGIEELQIAINNFNSMNPKKFFYPDYSVAVKFDTL